MFQIIVLYSCQKKKGSVLENKQVEFENFREYHFVLLGYSEFKDVYAKFNENLKFYRIASLGKAETVEIIYDVPENTLTEAGIIISTVKESGKRYLRVKKISLLEGELKRPTQTYILGRLDDNEEPSDYSMQLSQTIENAFTTQFTIDVDDVVKKVEPKIEIDISNDRYKLICGSGYRAELVYEKATYKDIKTKKTVEREGVTLRLPIEPCKESDELLKLVERKIVELAPYNLTRFEIAQKLLYPKIVEEDVQDNQDDE